MSMYTDNEIDLKIENIEPFVLEDCQGIVISWSSRIGFGQYTLRAVPSISDPNIIQWLGESECIDDYTHKEFGRKLMQLWMDQVLLIE